MTYEELLNNYEFKVATRVLKQEFPFITKVYMRNPAEINEYTIIFVDVDVDPDKLFEYYNDGEPANYVAGYKRRKEFFQTPYLRIAFNTLPSKDTDGPNKVIEKISDSTAIPHHLKLPKPRKLRIGSYYFPYDEMT
jgi:hypothetical protein